MKKIHSAAVRLGLARLKLVFTPRPNQVVRASRLALTLTAVAVTAAYLSFGQSTTLAVADASFDQDMDVQLDNDGIVVTWVSAVEEEGYVEYATSTADLTSKTGSYTTTTDIRIVGYPGTAGKPYADFLNKRTHRVRIIDFNLAGETVYYRIISGGVPAPSTGIYTAGPLPTLDLTTPPNLAVGTVTYADGSGAEECLVYLRVLWNFIGSIENSMWVNTMTGSAGGYSKDLTNIRQDKNNQFFNDPDDALPYADASADAIISVAARCDPDLSGTLAITTADAPRSGGDYINLNLTVSPTPEWSVGDQSFSESGDAIVEFLLGQTSDVDESVNFATTNGTADSSAPGQDYGNSEVTGTVTVKAGETSTTTTIPIVDDSLDELDETFIITLSNPTGSGLALIADGTGIITIIDNDAPPDVSMSAVTAPVFDKDLQVQVFADRFVAVWTTVSFEPTVIEYANASTTLASQGGGGGTVVGDTRSGFSNGFTHSAQINGSGTFAFDIFSGGLADPSGPHTVSNAGLSAPPISSISVNGLVFQPDGTTGAPDCLIHLQIQTPTGNSQWANTVTALDGSYAIGIGSLFNESLTGAFPYTGATSTSDILAVTAICSAGLRDSIAPTTAESFALEVGGDILFLFVDLTVVPSNISASVAELDSPLTTTADVAVSLSAVSGLPVEVDFATTDNTAAASTDYVAVSGALTIPAGSASGTIRITVNGDDTFENDETFIVTLSNATTTGITTPLTITQATSAVTIANDDKPSTAANSYATNEDTSLVVDASGVLGNDPSANVATLTAVNFSTPAKGALTLTIADGTFVYDPSGHFESLGVGDTEDVTFTYQARFSGALIVDSDPTTTTITVTGVNDAPVAVDNFYTALSGQLLTVPAPGVVGNDTDVDDPVLAGLLVSDVPSGQGTLTFGGDGSFTYDPGSFVGTTFLTYRAQDPLGLFSNVATVFLNTGPTFNILAPATVAETDGTITVTITLTDASTTVSTVQFTTEDGTALAGQDYVPDTRFITLSAINTTTAIVVSILGDTALEGPESFSIKLSSPSNAVISDSVTGVLSLQVIIDDPEDVAYAIPGLTEWGLIVLASLIAFAFLWSARRRVLKARPERG